MPAGQKGHRIGDIEKWESKKVQASHNTRGRGAANRRRVAATERMRRYRARKARELSIVPMPCNDESVIMLLGLNWLLTMMKQEAVKCPV